MKAVAQGEHRAFFVKCAALASKPEEVSVVETHILGAASRGVTIARLVASELLPTLLLFFRRCFILVVLSLVSLFPCTPAITAAVFILHRASSF